MNNWYVIKSKLRGIKLICKASVMMITDDWRGGYTIQLRE